MIHKRKKTSQEYYDETVRMSNSTWGDFAITTIVSAIIGIILGLIIINN